MLKDEKLKLARDQYRKEMLRFGQMANETFGSPAGKTVLERLVETYYQPSCFDSDPLKMARNVGCRDLVAEIVNAMEAAKHVSEAIETNPDE